MKKVTTARAAVLAMCAALVVGSAPVAQAQPVAGEGRLVAAGLPQTGDQLSYVQRGGAVQVYRSGERLADVRVASAAHPEGRGKLVLTVKAHQTFALRFGQFVWADATGDHDAVSPLRKVRIKGGTTESVSIRFDGVENGNVLWAPRRENTVGAWKVSARRIIGLSHLLSPSYVQRDAVVSVYKAGAPVARVTAQSAVHAEGKGALRLEVEVLKKISLRPAAFVWVDEAGERHRVVNARKVTVAPKTTRTLTFGYTDVEAGEVVWSPRVGVVAGAWGVG
ncbi:hypothetical protein [Kineosporia sp. NBRC 101731]|uniref:hypothetical protein n=1 Tax=Kineosporia sp. NBRC 101731 TaxID=3032199 RepID=UPI0024A50D06|nr:hypothetical protein [Kineosporia sp. NBRC 101731]GLY27402.1 hypothetical protein Kisp02_07670 [Kineosporia sp. NBRC 101731]